MARQASMIGSAQMADEPYITAKELARKLGIDQVTLRAMRQAGTIRPVPIGKKGRYLYSQVREQINEAASKAT